MVGQELDWSVLREWGLQVPVVGLMFAVVLVFAVTVVSLIVMGYKHQRAMVSDLRETTTENTKLICDTTRSCLDQMKELGEETTKSLDRNTEAFNRNTEAYAEVKAHLVLVRQLNETERPHYDRGHQT